MWRSYLGERAEIFGMDIIPGCKQFEGGKTKIFTGDQSDDQFLRQVCREIGTVDIIIDDGSHIPQHQIKSFEVLFYNLLSNDGIYICEDCHTNYWAEYGGGLRKSGTFIEYAKTLCDQVNAWVASQPSLKVNEATQWIKCVTFFSSVVVIERAKMAEPTLVFAGKAKIDLEMPFKAGQFSDLVLNLKKSKTIRSLVRSNPWLWTLMKRFMR